VLAAAVREVTEETGLRVVFGRPLRPSVYETGGRTKRVRYWVARCAGSAGFVPGHEVDQIAWLATSAARERLSYQRDVALLDEFRSGPAASVPFILLRHAAAGRKSSAGSWDIARPLDSRGVADAKLLAGLLACYGPCRVISSAAERCIATVRPYASAVGVPVEVEPAFSVSAAGSAASSAAAKAAERDRAARAAERATELAASGAPTLICVHRENLPAIIAAAYQTLRAPAAEIPTLRKGAFLVLHSADGALVSSERHDLTR